MFTQRNNRGNTVPVRPPSLFLGSGRVVRRLESTPVKRLEFFWGNVPVMLWRLHRCNLDEMKGFLHTQAQ